MKTTIRYALAAAAAALACAAGTASADTKETMQRNLAIFERYAGEPVEQITAFRGIRNWQPLGKEALALWADEHRVYLVRVDSPCTGLDFTTGIRVEHTHPVLQARFDSIDVEHQHCRILEIRPVDYVAARKELYGRAESRDR